MMLDVNKIRIEVTLTNGIDIISQADKNLWHCLSEIWLESVPKGGWQVNEQVDECFSNGRFGTLGCVENFRQDIFQPVQAECGKDLRQRLSRTETANTS